jgi:hypothetical protein
MGNLDIAMMNYSFYTAHLGLVWFYMVLWQPQQFSNYCNYASGIHKYGLWPFKL